MYNLGIILVCWFYTQNSAFMALAEGVIIGAGLHLLVQIPEAVHYGYIWQSVMDLKNPAIKKF